MNAHVLQIADVHFISDLHLHQSRPETSDAFFDYLQREACSAKALLILGDLFDAWVGDDQIEHDLLARTVVDEVRSVADSGVDVFFMRGNRDFLAGARFAKAAGLEMIDDPYVVEIDGKRTILMHGDSMCLDDVPYQTFRSQSRSPEWQAAFLAKPYDERVAFATMARARSTFEKSLKSEDIMDVSDSAVHEAFRNSGAERMIHGHTHRPAVHHLLVDGVRRERIVLADWP